VFHLKRVLLAEQSGRDLVEWGGIRFYEGQSERVSAVDGEGVGDIRAGSSVVVSGNVAGHAGCDAVFVDRDRGRIGAGRSGEVIHSNIECGDGAGRGGNGEIALALDGGVVGAEPRRCVGSEEEIRSGGVAGILEVSRKDKAIRA
jgi:hypothetical protein